MKVEKVIFGNLTCRYCRYMGSDKVVYVLYPMDSLENWITAAIAKYKTTIVVITGVDWDNDLTPWPAPGIPKGSPKFEGHGAFFQKELTETVIPDIERRMGFHTPPERTLVGVSLSGLFTLWQWAQSTFFRNIATLSGSFWYQGFVEWIGKQSFAGKTGRCFMLLGEAEPHSTNPVFATVGKCTEYIVGCLRRQHVSVSLKMVKGNHYQYPIERLEMALSNLLSDDMI